MRKGNRVVRAEPAPSLFHVCSLLTKHCCSAMVGRSCRSSSILL
jgi:hypothetical protein